MEANLIPKKRRNKKNFVSTFNSSGGKVIFTLLTEVIAFYMRFATVHV